MNTAQAKRIIVVSVLLSGTLASIKPLTQNKLPDVKVAVGVIVIAVFLLTLAEVQPDVAGAFALLMLFSSMFAVGPETYRTLTRAGGHEPKY